MSNELQEVLDDIQVDKFNNLKPENIKSGIKVLGVTGVYDGEIDTTDATATEYDLVSPKTAYVKDRKITGAIIPEYITVDATKYFKADLNYTLSINNSETIQLNDRIFYVYRKDSNIYIIVIKDDEIEAGCYYTLSSLFGQTDITNILLTYDSYDADTYTLCIGKGYNNGNGSTFVHFRRVQYNSNEKAFQQLAGIATTSWVDTGNNYGYTAHGSSVYPNSLYVQYSYWQYNLNIAYAKITWSDTSGSITTMANSSRTSNFSYGIEETGDGHQFSCINRFYVLNDIRNAWSYISTSSNVFISHNCQYMVYANALYKVSRNENATTMFNSKVLIQSGLPNYTSVKFSSNDAYMLLYTNSTLYVYRFTDEGYTLIQTIAIANMAMPFEGDYFLNIEASALIKYEYTSGQVIKSLSIKDTIYNSLDESEVPNSSEVLVGVRYMGVTEPLFGTMPNNGTLNYIPQETDQTIPLGYTKGGSIAALDITNISHYKRCLELSNQIISKDNLSNLIYAYELNQLTHMWDGIENSVNGHSSTITPWYDFMQSTNTISYGDAAPTWDSDSLNAYSNYTYLLSNSFTVNECTIEITGRWKVGQQNGSPVSFGTNDSNIFGLHGLTSSSVIMRNQGSTKTININLINHICTITLVRKADGLYLYKDGNLIDVLYKTNSTITGQLQLGGINTHTFCRVYMDINCIRLYNTALSAESILSNFLNDRIRFNF